MDNTLVIRYLTLLDLPLDKTYTIEDLKLNYKRLSKIYHPDTCAPMYKDGTKFKEFSSAYEFLNDNIIQVNNLINNKFNNTSNYNSQSTYDWYDFYTEKERRMREEENRKRREYEERKKRAEAEAKRKAEEEAARKAEQERIKKEQEEKRRKEELSKFKENLKLTLSKMNDEAKSLYSEKNYLLYSEKIMNFYNAIDKYESKQRLEHFFGVLLYDLERISTLKQEKFAKKTKIIAGLIVALITFILTFIFINNEYIVPNRKYNDAINYAKSGRYAEAEQLLIELGDYKDSEIQLKFIEVYKYCNKNNAEFAVDWFDKLSYVNTELVINYDTQGGILSSSSYYSLEICSKEGYKFDKWNIEEYDIKLNKDIYELHLDLKADFSLINYNIAYFLNGGEMSETPNSFNVENNHTIPNPTRDGYTFKGWKVNNSSDLVFDFSTNGKYENLKLEAVWSPVDFKVFFDDTCGSVANTSIELEYDQYYILSTPQKEGHKFLGWYLNGVEFINNGTWKQKKDIVLSAKWELLRYTISFNSDGGSLVTSITDYFGTEVSAPNNPVKEGYEFLGWKCNEEYYIFDKMPSRNIELKAEWKANQYIITLDVNGGQDILNNVLTVNYLTEIVLPLPFRKGYKFNGWLNNGLLYDKKIYDDLYNITLVASWEIINYHIEYELDGGVHDNSKQEFNVNDSDIIISYPTKEGYKFNGWYVNEENILQKDVIIVCSTACDYYLVANWELIEYNIIYDLSGGKNNTYNPSTFSILDLPLIFQSPTHNSYLFKTWQINGNNGDSISKIGDYKLTAIWSDGTKGLEFTFDNESYQVSGYTGSSYEVIIPDMYNSKYVTALSANVFKNSNITCLFIPETITYIDYTSVCYTSSLSNIIVDSNNSFYKSYDDVCLVELKSDTVIKGCTSYIPSVSKIGKYAYSNLSITSITIPSSITYIGQFAFEGCTKLSSVIANQTYWASVYPLSSPHYGKYHSVVLNSTDRWGNADKLLEYTDRPIFVR